VRRARLEGKSALWIPGTDHAGIATQTVVERELRKEKKTRRGSGREKFVERSGNGAREGRHHPRAAAPPGRLVRLGPDPVHHGPGYSRAVLGVFVELFRRGHIYRGKRMVNWCPASMTALSDEEVIMKPVNGTLYKVRYEFVGPSRGVTSRWRPPGPRRSPGDVAIAVHPDDPRYAGVVGRRVWRPLNRAEIPVIADPAVDPKFGSGALKITPAHDRVDYEIGLRHGLPVIDILNADGP
jgi:valyl-tRNA synthetase